LIFSFGKNNPIPNHYIFDVKFLLHIKKLPKQLFKTINGTRKITFFRSATQFAHTCGSLEGNWRNYIWVCPQSCAKGNLVSKTHEFFWHHRTSKKL